VSKVLLVVLVLFQNGLSVGHAITAPTIKDCRAAQPAITQEYRDGGDAFGGVKDVKSVCIEFA
jgi:hypothetical protein